MRNAPVSSAAVPVPDRRVVLADAAIAVLGTQGARGLTHRSVDRAAGLVTGSTSNIFRTREELLIGALDRLIAGDFVELPEPPPGVVLTPALACEAVVALLDQWLHADRRARLVARYELLLEASRRPTFAGALMDRRAEIMQRAQLLMEQLGSAQPSEQARSLVTWIDGLLLESVVDQGSAAHAPERLRALVARQLQPWT